MTIATVNELENAINCDFSKLIATKNDPVAGNAIVGGFHSFWRSTTGTVPAQPATPTTATVLTNLSVGAITFTQQTSPRQSYITSFSASCSAAGATIEIHDRLVAMGGLNLRDPNQTVAGMDLSTYLAGNNIAARIGDANYSDVQWWLEWYTNTGTSVTVGVNVTYNDGTTGTFTIPALGATVRASRMIPLNPYIPVADSGKFIRAVTQINPGDSGTTGNLGVTATRYRCSAYIPTANKLYKRPWMDTGLAEIYNQSCLFPVCIATATTIGNIRLDGIIAHG